MRLSEIHSAADDLLEQAIAEIAGMPGGVEIERKVTEGNAAEMLWWRCHRRLIAEFLHARGEHVVHLLGPGKRQEHKPLLEAEARDGRLYLCGALVA
jgi:uncharacterized protein (DUF488 family)